MAKRTDKTVYRSVKLLEDIVLKANIITEVNGGTAAEYISGLIQKHQDLERDYTAALKKLEARSKSNKRPDSSDD